jgi:hypothetical protein
MRTNTRLPKTMKNPLRTLTKSNNSQIYQEIYRLFFLQPSPPFEGNGCLRECVVEAYFAGMRKDNKDFHGGSCFVGVVDVTEPVDAVNFGDEVSYAFGNQRFPAVIYKHLFPNYS